MKQTINEHQFINAFDKDENFSYEALELLFKYVEMSKEELLDLYPIEIRFPSLNSEEEKEDIVQRYLENNTAFVGKTSSGFVFSQH